jgi:hypothetical protein
MAKPPKLKTLRPEDYDFSADASEWAPKLLQALSTFCSDVTNALSGLLDSENIRREDRDFEFTTPSGSVALDAAPFPIVLKPQKVTYPKGVTVLDPVVADGAVPAAAAQVIKSLDKDGNVVVRYVTGIEVSKTYKMRIRLE